MEAIKETKFSVSTYFPNLENSPDPPYVCPLCNTHSLDQHNPLIFEYSIFTCGNCGFVGNIISLHAKSFGIPYIEALAHYDKPITAFRTDKSVWEQQSKIIEMLELGRLWTNANVAAAENILASVDIPVKTSRNPALLPQLYVLPSSLLQQYKWPQEIPWLRTNDAVVIPFFFLPGVISSLVFLSDGNSRTYYVPMSGKKLVKEGGLHVFDSRSDKQLLISSVKTALILFDSFSRSNYTDPCPIVLFDPKHSRFIWDNYPGQQRVVLLEDNLPTQLPVFRNRVKYYWIGQKALSSLRNYSISKTIETYIADSVDFATIVQQLVTESKDIQNQLASMDFLNSDLERFVQLADQKDKRNLRTVLNIADTRENVMTKTEIYYRLPEGGIISEKRGNVPSIKELSNCDLRMSSYLVTESGTYMRGALRFFGEDIPTELKVTNRTSLPNSACIRQIAFTNKTPSIPWISNNGYRTWYKVCESFSAPIVVNGSDHVGLKDDEYILPGVVVTSTSAERYDKLRGAHKVSPMSLRIPTKAKLITQTNNTPENIDFWGLMLGCFSLFLGELYNLQPKTVALLHSKPNMTKLLLDRFRLGLNLTSERVACNHPGIMARPYDFALCPLGLTNLYAATLTKKLHIVSYSTPSINLRLSDFRIQRLLIDFIRHSLAIDSRELTKEATCGCSLMFDEFERFLYDDWKIHTPVIQRARENWTCGTGIGIDSGSNLDPALRLLSTLFFFQEHKMLTPQLEFTEEAVTIEMAALVKAVHHRLKSMSLLFNKNDIVDSLLQHNAYLDGSELTTLRINRAFWAKHYPAWKTHFDMLTSKWRNSGTG